MTSCLNRKSASSFIVVLSVCLVVLTAGIVPCAWAGATQLFLAFNLDLKRLDDIAERYAAVIWHNHPVCRQAIAVFQQRDHAAPLTLMYRDMYVVLERESDHQESVGHYDWINQHHPEWFQLDTSGQRIEIDEYPGQWMMDPGHPDWQDFWIERTRQDVLAFGWDGVFVDDVLTSVRAHDLPPLLGYPDDAALQDAVYGFLSRITEAFHAVDKQVVANVSSSYDYPGLWERWLAVTDGLLEEHFAGEAWTWGPHVATRQLQAMRTAAEQGRRVFSTTYGGWDNLPRQRHALAAYLLGASRQSAWRYQPGLPAEGASRMFWSVPNSPDVGQPLAGPIVEDVLWQRPFERGWILLNAGADMLHVDHPVYRGWIRSLEILVVTTDASTGHHVERLPHG